MKDLRAHDDFIRTFFKRPPVSSFAESPSLLARAWARTFSAPSGLGQVGLSDSVSAAALPVMYTFGTVNYGDCLGQSAVGAGHGPVVGSKSVWAALDDSLFTPQPSSSHLSYEAICVYQHQMADTFGAPMVGYAGEVPDSSETFFTECHTNGGCTSPDQIGRSVFLNLQGDGISDEYGKPKSSLWAGWYEANFGEASIFESS